MLGIGAKDDIYYIQYARESWKIKFPLFPDADLIITRMVGLPGTPYFICVKKDEKGKIEIFYTHEGAVTAADKFINTIVEKSGLNF